MSSGWRFGRSGSIAAVLMLLVAGPQILAHTPTAHLPRSVAASVSVSRPGWSPGLDWPTYLGNPERTSFDQNESALASGNVSGLQTVWTSPTPGGIESSPVVADGRVFVSSWDGNLTAYNVSDGSLDWRTFVGTSTFRACAASGPRGPTATPTIENGSVYLPGGDPNFYALNESTGAIEWKVSNLVNSPSSGDYNWGSALVYGTSAYYGLSSACGNPGAQGMVVMINLNGTTHNVTHKFAVVPSGTLLGGVWSTPAIDPAKNLVWVTTGDGPNYGQSILALNATTLSLVGAWQEPHPNLDYDFGAGATLLHDGAGRPMVAALNKNGVVYGLDRSNVSSSGWGPVWEVNVSWYENISQGQWAGPYDLAPSAFDGTDLYVGGGFARLSNGTDVAGTVTSIVPGTGAIRWQVGAPGVVRAGVAVANGLMFDAADQANYRTAWFEARSASTGQLLYQLHLNGTINAAPTFSGGFVLFGSAPWGPKGPGTVWALALPMGVRWAEMPGPTWPGAPTPFRADVTGGSAPYRFNWTFGDRTSGSTAVSPVHSYPAPGVYPVTLNVTDAAARSAALSANVTVGDPPLSITDLSTSPTTVVVGGSMALVVATNGGWGPFGYTYQGLPAGCAGQNRSAFTCSPTLPGRYEWTVVVRDTYGGYASASSNVSVVPATPAPLSILDLVASPNPARAGDAFAILTVVSGGAAPVAYAYAGLPSACPSRNSSEVDCTTDVPGAYDVNATVTDSSGQTASRTVHLTVDAPRVTPLEILSFSVVPNTVELGRPVAWAVDVEGGSGNVTIQYSGLPIGCTNATARAVTCTPRQLGSFDVTVTAIDATGFRANSTAHLSVVAPPAPASSPAGPGLAWPWVIAIAAGTFLVGAVAVGAIRRAPGGK